MGAAIFQGHASLRMESSAESQTKQRWLLKHNIRSAYKYVTKPRSMVLAQCRITCGLGIPRTMQKLIIKQTSMFGAL